MPTLAELRFQNRFHALGADFYVEALPQGLQRPHLQCANTAVAQMLGLTEADLHSDLFLQVFSGNQLLAGMQPLAQAYAGHQFGTFNPFLGDGRSLLLGEVQTASGLMDLCLKGAGRTPFARNADGRAGLNECLHEYHISEQLAALGIPTARVLSVISGKPAVYRQGALEAAAMLVRVAPSHIRFGTFENYFYQRKPQAIRQLADHVIQWHYPQCQREGEDRYAHFLQTVVIKTAELIAHWQAAGFTHGVMNTDNQSIIGITLDIGGCGFTLDRDPEFVSNTLDEKKRYAFGQQPMVGLWNCNVLARALSALIPAADLRTALREYEPAYLRTFAQLTSV